MTDVRSGDRLGIADFEQLLSWPSDKIEGSLRGIPYTAHIALPKYNEAIYHHFRGIIPDGLPAACSQADISFGLPKFGLVVNFQSMAEIPVHGEDMMLDDGIRSLVAQFGPVILRNAVMSQNARVRFHRNIFPHLRFHVDRGPTASNQYSCFTRDPDDADQRPPRASSTLFMANIVAWLEMVRSGLSAPGDERGTRPSYDLFDGADMSRLLGKIVLEQPWSEPAGTGEIVVLDNRTTLHATYHKDGETKGYRIGARYLA
ncbi:MAG: hypothetical protein HQ514_00025 [Rhodospirillales bacterium]|nr:hypothetical protein [Rhodospirillales bacterium]